MGDTGATDTLVATITTGATGAAAGAVTANSPGTADTNYSGAEDKDKNQETQANNILPSPTSTLSKHPHNNVINDKHRLSAQLHTFLLQE